MWWDNAPENKGANQRRGRAAMLRSIEHVVHWRGATTQHDSKKDRSAQRKHRGLNTTWPLAKSFTVTVGGGGNTRVGLVKFLNVGLTHQWGGVITQLTGVQLLCWDKIGAILQMKGSEQKIQNRHLSNVQFTTVVSDHKILARVNCYKACCLTMMYTRIRT